MPRHRTVCTDLPTYGAVCNSLYTFTSFFDFTALGIDQTCLSLSAHICWQISHGEVFLVILQGKKPFIVEAAMLLLCCH